jgi:hypothetical protein
MLRLPTNIISYGRVLFSATLTVRTAPSMMKLKLKVCCVVLAAFSFTDRSPHGTLPSSLKAVTAFLLGRGVALVVPRPVWVAYNRAARIGRRLGGHLSRSRGRAKEFISRIMSLCSESGEDPDGMFPQVKLESPCGETS